MVDTDANRMKQDPEISMGSPGMGGLSEDPGDLTWLIREANAEEYMDTLLLHTLSSTQKP